MISTNLRNIVSINKRSINPKAGTVYMHYSLPAFDAGQPENTDGKSIKSSKLLVPRQCILMNKLNVRFKRIWPVESPEENAIASTEFLPLVPNGVDYWFLYYWLRSDETTSKLFGMRAGTSSSHQRINVESLLDLDVPLPSINIQQKIGLALSEIDSKIKLNTRLNDYLAA